MFWMQEEVHVRLYQNYSFSAVLGSHKTRKSDECYLKKTDFRLSLDRTGWRDQIQVLYIHEWLILFALHVINTAIISQETRSCIRSNVCLTTHEVRVSLSGLRAGHAPELGVPADHSAVLAEPVVTHVPPHAEQVQLHLSENGSWGSVSGTAAQPQGAGGGDGPSDDRPLSHHIPINLKYRNNKGIKSSKVWLLQYPRPHCHQICCSLLNNNCFKRTWGLFLLVLLHFSHHY